MTKKIVLGGVVGGLVLFIWGAVSHMVLPLGEVGIKELGNEAPIVAAMKENISEPGFYFFPGLGVPHASADQAAQEAWAEKYRQGPWGILIYHPTGEEPIAPADLVRELLSNMLVALVAALLLAQAGAALAGYSARVLFVALLGLVPGLETDFSYWNWYGFPTDYTLVQMFDHVVAYLLMGLVLAAIVKRS
ncbi:MAG: hypothetical protein HYY26_02170 [Acidobacteria bacterium]|nr:hypothetical protein [Acidobacteriota bacterium]